jgi:hypothetical protein
VFTVTTTADAGAGSLRQAIVDANAAANSGGPDVIAFNIATGPYVITPTSPLPDIIEAVVVDGYSQAGASVNNLAAGTNANLVIQLSGDLVNGGNGLVLAGSGGSTVTGLAIVGFGDGSAGNGSAIVLKSGGNKVAGNFLGTNTSGAFEGNANAGVAVGEIGFSGPLFAGNVIGGTANGDRNLITASKYGVLLGSQSLNTSIVGNLIGTNASGTGAVANNLAGVWDAGGSGTIIGDGSVAGGNVISGNTNAGIVVGNSPGIQIRGNFIGTNAAGNGALGNLGVGIIVNNGGSGGLIEGNVVAANGAGGIQLGSPLGDGDAFGYNIRANFIGTNVSNAQLGNSGAGIAIYSQSSNHVIGGTLGGQGNTIAYNVGAGIESRGEGSNNRFQGNSIRSNIGGLGIDLANSVEHRFGVTLNDPLDADNVTNWPTIQTFVNTGAAVTLDGVLDAKPNRTYRLEFFAMAPNQIDPSGFGGGAVFLGFRDVTTSGIGQGVFTFSEPFSLPADTAFSATATPLGNGSTSEFGPVVGVSTSYSWTGAVSGDWAVPGNWTPNGVPGALDSATVAMGSPVISGPVSVVNFTFSGGTMSGASELNVRGAFNWTGGTWAGGDLYVSTGASGNIGSGTAALVWSGGKFSNYGATTIASLGLNVNQGTIVNAVKDSVLTLNAGFTDPDGSVTPTSASNLGSIIKQGTGTFGFDGGIPLANQGTIRATAGTLRLSGFSQTGDGLVELLGGAIDSTGPLSLNGGQLAGAGTITGDVSATGATIYVGGKNAPGILTVTGNFSIGSAGRLVIDLAGPTPGTGYDQLSVSGSATLGGTVESVLLPALNLQGATAFTFINAASIGNTFTGQSGSPVLPLQYTGTQARFNVQGYTVTTTADSGAGSLRQAITDANAAAGLDLILFNIAGAGVKTIAPATPLPTITDSVFLDGYSQPGALLNTSSGSDYNGVPLIEIQGLNLSAASSTGLSLAGSGGSTVRGLILNEFMQSAIAISSGNNSIVGNWVGLRSNGVDGNLTGDGISIQSGSMNRVGAMPDGDRNIISANNVGIRVANASMFTVENNWFGLVGGNVALVNPFAGNGTSAIVVENTSGGQIGLADSGNVIAATLAGPAIRISNSNGINVLENRIGYNGDDALPVLGKIDGHGIVVENGSFAISIGDGSHRNRIVGVTGAAIRIIDSPGVSIQRNIIGATDTNGVGTYGNGGHGIHISGDASTNITIGGANADSANFITRNAGHGIYVENTTIQSDALIRKNSIWRNGLKGIQLTSPSGSIAAPVITNVTTTPDSINGGFVVDVTGSFSAAASTSYTIDLSSSFNGEGEGRVYLRSVNASTNATGVGAFSFSFNSGQANLGFLPGAIGGNFTATVSDLTVGSTSEFSAPRSPAPLTLVVTSAADSGPGTLRDAILIANQHPGRDRIDFNINGGGGVQTIFLTQNLPDIDDAVFINGYSQPGSAANTNAVGNSVTNAILNIALRGATSVNRGFYVSAGDSEFRGLNIAGMGQTGQFLSGQAFQFGGEGNNLVAGNFLGTDASGNSFVPNSTGGVFSSWSTGNIIGGTQAADRNIIASDTNGVDFFSQSNGGVVRGNIFGLGANGSTAMGNTHSAILINGSSKANVTQNVITNNGMGIRVGTNGPQFFDQSSGNIFSQNRIYNNSGFASGLGIDLVGLSGEGVSLNDVLDSDSGPNRMVNFPVITSVTAGSIGGTYAGAPSTTFTIELFSSATGDPSGYGEGTAYVGATTVTTDASGNGVFTFSGTIPAGQKFTATATGTEAGTSEFSQFVAAAVTHTWDGGGLTDTDWFNPLNWSSDTVPSPGDTAELLSNFTVTLTAPVTIAKFVQGDGIVNGGGSMTITSEFTWTKGTQTGPSTLTIASGATASLSSANAKVLDRRFLDNQGTITITDNGAFQYQNGPSITNSGVIEFQSDADLVSLDSTGTTFTNSGTIRKSGGTATTILGFGALNLTLNNSGTLDVDSGNLQVNAAGGTFSTGSQLTPASGAILQFQAGNFVLSGSLAPSDSGTVLFSGGNFELGVGSSFSPMATTILQLNGGTISGAGALNIAGLFTFTSGTLSGTGATNIALAASLVFSATGTKNIDSRPLSNFGTVTMNGASDVRLAGGVAISNSGLWNIAGDADIASVDAVAKSFTNNTGGILRKSSGAESFISETNGSLALISPGAIDVLVGTLTLNGGGALTSASLINIAGSAVLRLSGGTTTLDGNPTISGNGLLDIDQGGTLSLNAGTTFAVPTTTPLALTGTITGGGDMLISGMLSWGNGTLSGSGVTTFTSTAAVSADSLFAHKLSQRTLINNGTITWSNIGDFELNSGAVFTNNGLIELRSTANFASADATAKTFTNSATGTLRKTTDAGQSTSFASSAVTFNNSGRVEVLMGALSLALEGTWSGGAVASVSAAASLELGGAKAFDGVINFSGGGTTTLPIFASMTLNPGSTLSVASGHTLTQEVSATVTGAGLLNIGGTLNINGGIQSGSGATNIAVGGVVNIGANFDLNARTLSNAGVVNQSGGNVRMLSGATVSNTGTWEISGDQSFTASAGGGSIQNLQGGTFSKTGGTGTSTIASPNSFSNEGSVSVASGVLSFGGSFSQTGGVTMLNGGNLGGGTVFAFSGGILVGTGTIVGTLNNSGATIRPAGAGSSGTLSVTGTYSQSGTGKLAVDVGGSDPGDSDLLSVSGTATLGGALEVAFINGFIPAAGDTIEVLSGATRVGTFGSTTGLQTLGAAYTTTSATLVRNGAVFTWDAGGGGDTDWHNPANWDLDFGVPGVLDSVVIDTAASVSLGQSVALASLDFSSGSLSGAGIVTVNSGLTWSGGEIALAVTTGPSSTNSLGGSASMVLDGALLALGGTTTFGGNNPISLTGANAEIRNTGSFNITDSAGIVGSGLFHNFAASGGIERTGSGESIIEVAFAAGAEVNVLDGSLTLNGGSSWISGVGVTVATSTAILNLGGGTHTFNGDNAFDGLGKTVLSAGEATFTTNPSTVGVGHKFEQASGTLSGDANIVINGTFDWKAGSQEGPGDTVFSATAFAFISGPGSKLLDLRTFDTSGAELTISGDGDIDFANGAALKIGGVATLSAATSFTNGGGALSSVEVLAGAVLTKSGGGIVTFDVPFSTSGEVRFEGGSVNFSSTFQMNDGEVTLVGGGVSFSDPAELVGGLFTGAGSIDGSLNNTGATVSPGSSAIGQFILSGSYTQGAGGVLEMGLASGASVPLNDQITVGTSASLDGHVAVTYSGFFPAGGFSASLINGGAISGTFGSEAVSSPFVSEYLATAFTVKVPINPPGLVSLSSLLGRNGAFIPGIVQGDEAGVSVSGLGSINGDSFGDFAIGAPGVDGRGAVYVIFGKAGSFGVDFDLETLDGTEGFKISGGIANDAAGISVSSPGDVNGDGIRDILIGDSNFDGAFINTGAAYVIYGRSAGYPAEIDLSTLTAADGFRMETGGAADFAGMSVAGAGDINGDGIGDMIVGVPDSDIAALNAGAAYVVFGRSVSASPFPVAFSLTSLSSAEGFVVLGSFAGDRFGTSVSAAGDVNRDGFGDLVIGAPTFDGLAGADTGAAYVLFGKAGGFNASIDAGSLNGKTGFRMEGRAGNERLGIRVSSAGDMNGDGFDDLLLGGRFALHPVTDENVAVAYVVFGKQKAFSPTVDLASLNGANGFRVFTDATSLPGMVSVAGVEDFNGDGLDDIAIGLPGNVAKSGMTYLMFGRRGGFATDLSLHTLNATTGFRFEGEFAFDESGTSVAAGDINGDGRSDLLIGAPHPGDEAQTAREGGAYLIYGFATNELPVVSAAGTAITFDDVDGDIITIKATNGKVTADMLVFGPGGVLQMVDLTAANTLKDGANITFSVKQNGGNGVLNVGAIHAEGLRLGKVSVTGDLGQIDVGGGDPLKPALKQLVVGSLGELGGTTQQEGTENPLVSDIGGSLPKLLVKGNFKNATFNVLGKLGSVTVNGDFSGTGAFDASQLAGLAAIGRGEIGQVAGGNTLASSGLSAGGIGALNIKGSVSNAALKSSGGISSATVGGSVNKGAIVAAGAIRVVKVFGAITSDDPAVPSVIAALASPPSSKPAAATAINSLSVRGEVRNAEILLGYDSQFNPVNGDASAGRITINGNFTASSISAGVNDATGDGFGRNDMRIGAPADDPTPKIVSRIASLVIKGIAEGSEDDDDAFGITAQKISSVKINGVKIVLDKLTADDRELGTKGDLRLVEVI